VPAVSSPAASAYVLRVLEVGASIDLDAAEARLRGREIRRGPSALRGPLGAGTGGVLLARPPLDVTVSDREVGGMVASARVRVFEFGVVSVRFRLPIDQLSGKALVLLAASIEDDAGFDDAAREIWTQLAGELGTTVSQSNKLDLVEDYSVFVLPRRPTPDGTAADPIEPRAAPPGGDGEAGDTLESIESIEARELVASDEILTRMLLGEDDPRPLHAVQIEETRARAIRYFADDLVLVDFDAAVVLDPLCSPELVDIFELATAYLVELRYYDALLSRALAKMATDATSVRQVFWLLRSPFQALAERAILLVLELTELTDNFERSIVLLGDTYSVQVYRAAADRFRIAEVSASVHAKLEMLARSGEALGDHLHGQRGLALEMLVIVLIAVEVGMAFVRH
jgi:hypothetical protein